MNQNEQNNQIQIPLIIQLDDTKRELAQLFNKATRERGIPYYFLEPVLTELLTQVRNGAAQELAMMRAQTKGAAQTAP